LSANTAEKKAMKRQAFDRKAAYFEQPNNFQHVVPYVVEPAEV